MLSKAELQFSWKHRLSKTELQKLSNTALEITDILAIERPLSELTETD